MSSPAIPQAEKALLTPTKDYVAADNDLESSYFTFYPLSPTIRNNEAQCPSSPADTERNSSPIPEEKTKPTGPVPLKRKLAVRGALQ